VFYEEKVCYEKRICYAKKIFFKPIYQKIRIQWLLNIIIFFPQGK